MSRERLSNARGATLLVYGAETALALVVALPLAARISSAVSNLPNGTNSLYEPGSAHFLDLIAQNSIAWGVGTFAMMVLLVGAWLVSPIIQMIWLHALNTRQPFSSAVANGLRQFGAAIRVSILLSPLFVLGATVASVGGVIGALATEGGANERTQFFATLWATVPGLLLMLHWAATHDLSRAALASGQSRARDAARRAWRKSLRAFPLYLVFLLLALALTVAGHAAGVRLDAGTASSAIVVLVVQQSISFARILARGRWLVSALRYTA